MQAQSAVTGLPVIAVACDAVTAEPAAANPPAVTPTLSQHAFDRWGDLPVDVVVQVMYWTLLGSGSSRWAASLALTSKHFALAGQDFRAGAWYRDAQSVVMHGRTVSWVAQYLNGTGNQTSVRSPKDINELNIALADLGSTSAHAGQLLDIESKLKAALNDTQLEGFRRYRGASLSLLAGASEVSGDHVVEIARALPVEVCLRVEFIARTFLQFTREDIVAGVIRRVALTGRATAFDLKWALDLTAAPDLLSSVLDIACGPGRIVFFGFGNLENPDVMLKSLGDRCDRFSHLKLVMFGCAEPPARELLASLADALERRQQAGRSRVTVVISCDELRSQNPPATGLFSADEYARFEAAGLVFAMLDNEPATHPSVRKVLRSLEGGTIDAWVAPPGAKAE